MKKICYLGLVLGLAACGTIPEITYEEAYATERQLPLIDYRGGQLCAFRVSNFVGSALAYHLYADDEYIGRLPNSSYFCINLEPGEYIISTKDSWNRAGTEVVIKQGQRKFIELSVATAGVGLHSVIRDVGLAGIWSTM